MSSHERVCGMITATATMVPALFTDSYEVVILTTLENQLKLGEAGARALLDRFERENLQGVELIRFVREGHEIRWELVSEPRRMSLARQRMKEKEFSPCDFSREGGDDG